MNEELDMIYEMLTEQLEKTIGHVQSEFAKLRAGRALPSMVDSVTVDYYGSQVPLSQVANINAPDARTLLIKPWEKPMLEEIAKSITNSNLGLNPQNDGENIFINIPVLTEERRRDLMKQVKAAAEHGRIGIRSARKDANEEIKNLEKDGLSEDLAKKAADNVQSDVDSFNKKIDNLIEAKEKEVMTV